MPSNVSICLILPAYNEEITIKKSILDFHKTLKHMDIWVIDNCSSDKTSIIAKKTIKDNKIAGGVIRELKKGKSNAVRRAFLELDYDVYVMCDADCTYPSRTLKFLVKPVLDNQFDMVVGNRHSNKVYSSQNKRIFHNFGNNLIRKLVNILFNNKFNDILSGYRVFNKSFVKSYPIIYSGFELETDMSIFAAVNNLRVLEVPIDYMNRPEGSVSKLNTFKDGFRVLITIFNLFRHYKPMLFFGTLGFVTLLIGLLFGFFVVKEYILFSYVYKVPLAILSGFTVLTSFLLFLIAAILDSISNQSRKQDQIRIINFNKK
jgi:glycosyltransferase involved in cell wall biosynthesis